MSDAIADNVVIKGVEFYIIQFPTERKTIAVNVDNYPTHHHAAKEMVNHVRGTRN